MLVHKDNKRQAVFRIVAKGSMEISIKRGGSNPFHPLLLHLRGVVYLLNLYSIPQLKFLWEFRRIVTNVIFLTRPGQGL